MRGHCCCCSKEREEQGGKRRFHVRTDCFTKNKSAESEFISTDRSVPTGCIMVWNGGYMVVDANNTRMVSFKTQFETAIAKFEMN
jgi:hypothetical protein